MPSSPPRAPLSRGVVLLLAIAAGASAANLYYAQPLLGTIARELDVSEGAAGGLVTVIQVGYVIGLAFIVPLSDLLERRRLLWVMAVLAAVAAAGCAVAPGFAALVAGTFVLGVVATAAQVAVPLSASLAGEGEAGKVVGSVMSGLLIGILGARVVAGLIAGLGEWRAVYAFAAVVMLALAALLRVALPRSLPPEPDLAYRDLLRSTVRLVREERVLRQRMALGATGFAVFSILWTSLAFLLEGDPFDYGETVIGLFGLAGIAGALAAPLAGRASDGAAGPHAMTAFLVLLPASWALLAIGGGAVVPLLLGIVMLDFGVQAAHISNQSAIYALRPEARGRLTTAYIVAYFFGGAAGSALSALAWSLGEWPAVCGLGACVGLLAVLLWLTRFVDPIRSRSDAAPADRPVGHRPDHAG